MIPLPGGAGHTRNGFSGMEQASRHPALRTERPSWRAQWAVPARRTDQGSDCGAAQIHRSAQKSAARRSRSIGSGRLQEYNHPGAVLGRFEPAIWLHVVAGHNLIGFRDEAIELLLIPYKLRALHGTGIAVVRKRTGFSSDDIVEVWAQAIVRFLGRMAGPACVVECQLPRLGVGVGALARRLLGHSRELQKHQERDAHQSRDCGAGHKASSRLNARSRRFVLVIPAKCLYGSEYVLVEN